MYQQSEGEGEEAKAGEEAEIGEVEEIKEPPETPVKKKLVILTVCIIHFGP